MPLPFFSPSFLPSILPSSFHILLSKKYPARHFLWFICFTGSLMVSLRYEPRIKKQTNKRVNNNKQDIFLPPSTFHSPFPALLLSFTHTLHRFTHCFVTIWITDQKNKQTIKRENQQDKQSLSFSPSHSLPLYIFLTHSLFLLLSFASRFTHCFVTIWTTNQKQTKNSENQQNKQSLFPPSLLPLPKVHKSALSPGSYAATSLDSVILFHLS